MVFAEYRGFWRVQVLGFVVTQHPSAKTDAFALDVADGEHHPVAKPVVAFLFPAAFLRVRDDQPALDQ